MIRKIILVATICTLVITLFAAPVSAVESRKIVHNIPNTTMECTGFLTTTHTRYVGVYNGAHQLEDGTVCYFTAVRWEHTTVCDECSYHKVNTYDCRVEHTVCGESVTCPYSY